MAVWADVAQAGFPSRRQDRYCIIEQHFVIVSNIVRPL